jgi:hypothetical protein
MDKFIIPFTKDIHRLLKYGRQQSKAYRGEFNGNSERGNFDFEALGSRFVGSYLVKKKVIEINISKKPFFIPRVAIDRFLKLHISKF